MTDSVTWEGVGSVRVARELDAAPGTREESTSVGRTKVIFRLVELLRSYELEAMITCGNGDGFDHARGEVARRRPASGRNARYSRTVQIRMLVPTSRPHCRLRIAPVAAGRDRGLVTCIGELEDASASAAAR